MICRPFILLEGGSIEGMELRMKANLEFSTDLKCLVGFIIILMVITVIGSSPEGCGRPFRSNTVDVEEMGITDEVEPISEDPGEVQPFLSGVEYMGISMEVWKNISNGICGGVHNNLFIVSNHEMETEMIPEKGYCIVAVAVHNEGMEVKAKEKYYKLFEEHFEAFEKNGLLIYQEANYCTTLFTIIYVTDNYDSPAKGTLL